MITISYIIFRKKSPDNHAFPWKRIFSVLLFVGYLLVILYATLLRGHSSSYRQFNIHLFRAWREAWNNFSVKNWANILLNIAMFVPLGVLLPVLWKQGRKWFLTLPMGFALSLFLELAQFLLYRGTLDVDDLFANTLGTALGFFGVMTLLTLFSRKDNRKTALIYFIFTALPIVGIGSIFLIYQFQEYGNLPNAAAYSHNTSAVTWTLDCQLPTLNASQSVYRTQVKSTDQCDAFAEEIAETFGMHVDLTSYYQDFAYYNLHPGGLLLVNYFDGSYEFHKSGSGPNTPWTQTDRQTLETALKDYPVLLPAEAVFTSEEDGWHSFSIDCQVYGSILYDGTLRVRYADPGSVQIVENNLCSFVYYKDLTIISPEEAYAQLVAGNYQDDGYFESANPDIISVTECTLDYQVDTKGFYQPIYHFSLESDDGSYIYRAMIPAMK